MKLRWTIGVLTLLILGVLAYRTAPQKATAETFPVYGEIDEFKLVNQAGVNYSANDLRGSVHVVNFIFTSCPGVCPLLTQQMAKVQKKLKNKNLPAKLLSISVDPERDSPEVLSEYAKKYGADLERWNFLTGELETIQKVVVDSFKSMMGRKEGTEEDPDLFEIVHGENFVILDRNSRIRAFQKIKSEEDVLRVLQIVQLLEKEAVDIL